MSPAVREPGLRETLHRRLLDAPFDPSSLGRPELRERLARMLREEAPLLASATADVFLDELVDDVGGLGPLEPLLADPTITEIMVNGADRVFVERAGRIVEVQCEIDTATIVRVVERVVAPLGLRLDRASPMVDAASRRRFASARGAPAARARRAVRVDPPLRRGRGSALGVRRRARGRGVSRRHGARGLEHRRVRRDELGQDDLLQRARRDRSIRPSGS